MSKVPQIKYMQLDLLGHAKIVGFAISSLVMYSPIDLICSFVDINIIFFLSIYLAALSNSKAC